jgi:hypothetical protein
MVLKAISFNRRALEENFEPYIGETLDIVAKLTLNLLQSIPPDTDAVSMVSYCNLL